jgi:hypothetical protein
MTQILSLQKNVDSYMRRESGGLKQGCGTTHVVLEEFSQLTLKLRVFSGGEKGLFQFFERGHQSLGHEPSPIFSKMSRLIG